MNKEDKVSVLIELNVSVEIDSKYIKQETLSELQYWLGNNKLMKGLSKMLVHDGKNKRNFKAGFLFVFVFV